MKHAVMQVQEQIDRLLAFRASQWLDILKHAGAREREEFAAWLAQSRLHVQEMLEIVAVDRELGNLDPHHSEDVEALIRRITSADETASLQQRRITEVAPSAARRLPAAWKRYAALAAAASVVALGIAFYTGLAGDSQSFETTTGEQRAIELGDASVVHLNAGSRIEVDFGAQERTIRLVRGEAMFKVAREPDRPFRVYARGATVQALGTQFNVYDRADGTRVSVLEGRVKVTPVPGAPGRDESRLQPAPQTLQAGEEAQIGSDGIIDRPHERDVRNAVAWLQRRLVFYDAPLEEMIAEFNRYSRSVRLRLEGVAPGSHRYDGVFDADDPESLADILTREPDLEVEKREGEILVRPRSARPRDIRR